MIDTVCIVGAILALIPACNTFNNLRLLRRPAKASGRPRVAILIPARDEEANIGACVDAALASEAVDLEVLVLDDGSTDATASIVAARAAGDPRLRLHAAPPLPPGWRGKPHACHVLAGLTDAAVLLFVDADVRLAPDAAVRLVPPAGVDLVSGVPRQILGTWAETAVVPMINTLIYGFLPVGLMRARPDASLAAACGQMIAVRASAYHACGGHAAIPTTMHDGLTLPRAFRKAGSRTDLIDGTDLATCRMYQGTAAVLSGFGKNATEGMARPVALPIWTVLLTGAFLAPVPVLLAAAGTHALSGAALSLLIAFALLLAARVAQAVKCREPWAAVILQPLGTILTLAIQWNALARAWLGSTVEWRGRQYAAAANGMPVGGTRVDDPASPARP